MLKALLKMERLSERDKPARGQVIHDSMTGNANFQAPNPLPNPTLTAVQTAITEAQDAVVDYDAKLAVLRTALGVRNDAVNNMMLLLNNLAGYVTSVANGDGAVITSAGMFVADDRTPPQPMPQPEGLRTVSTGAEDAVRLLWNPIDGAKTYLVECASSINGPWTQVNVTTSARADVGSLTPGTRYYLRVRAVNATGPGPWSDVIVKIAG